ncbi:MAG: tetratricopeptide repeat protein, partial [Alphaproteobacteria bacterium]
PVWNDRFEVANDMLDQLHDRVVAQVVARIDPAILFIEGQQAVQRRSGAASLVLQALPAFVAMQRGPFEKAGDLLTEALRIEPQNAKAAAWKAFWHVFHTGQGWASDLRASLEAAQELALRAVRNDPESAEAHAICGHVCSFFEKDYDLARHYFNMALRLNPNITFAWAMSAATYNYAGDPDAALQHLQRYTTLASFDPNAYFGDTIYTTTYVLKGDYAAACRFGKRAVRACPDFSNGYKHLIAALGHLGRREEAAPYVQKLLQLEPHFTIAQFTRTYPLARQEDRDNYARGLELAGVPKG